MCSSTRFLSPASSEAERLPPVDRDDAGGALAWDRPKASEACRSASPFASTAISSTNFATSVRISIPRGAYRPVPPEASEEEPAYVRKRRPAARSRPVFYPQPSRIPADKSRHETKRRHRQDLGRAPRRPPGAAVRGLTQLFLCAASLAIPIADHTGQPEWRALVTEIEGMLVRLDAVDAGYAEAAPSTAATAVARRRSAA